MERGSANDIPSKMATQLGRVVLARRNKVVRNPPSKPIRAKSGPSRTFSVSWQATRVSGTAPGPTNTAIRANRAPSRPALRPNQALVRAEPSVTSVQAKRIPTLTVFLQAFHFAYGNLAGPLSSK